MQITLDNIIPVLSIPLGILGIGLFFAFLVFIAKYRSPKAKGKRGEASVSNMIESLANDIGGLVINDVIVPCNGKTTQIDHILFCKRGIIVIETKNFSGRIYGDENSKYWTQTYRRSRKKYQHYNPVKQNETHINALKRILGNKIEMKSVIIFVRGDINYIRSNKVFDIYGAKFYISKLPEILNDDDVIRSYQKIKYYKDNPIATEQEHIDDINERYPK